MHWFLVHTKPRQETTALQNLEQQSFQCYLPTCPSERLRHGSVVVIDEPLFPRYLFIRLGRGDSAPSWSPIRSTKGVSRLVCFGSEPAKVAPSLIELLMSREAALQGKPQRLFSKGDRVQMAGGPFAGIEGVYQMADGECRAMVLIELLSRPVVVPVGPSALRKAG